MATVWGDKSAAKSDGMLVPGKDSISRKVPTPERICKSASVIGEVAGAVTVNTIEMSPLGEVLAFTQPPLNASPGPVVVVAGTTPTAEAGTLLRPGVMPLKPSLE
jgi:hypothetical protein